MPDTLDSLDLTALRMECLARGIHYPCGSALHSACKHELLEALRSPCYIEAFRLGLIGKDANGL